LAENGLVIPRLLSGGVMLSYRCSNACRHCLYRCSPRQPNEWMTLEMAERVFSALAAEEELQSIHIAGGEPGLRLDLLEEIIQVGVSMGIPIAYVETNASWCTDAETTRQRMQRLKEAGLPAILVSVSMFHNEFVPFERTRICVEAGGEVFGRDNVIIYLPHMYDLLSQMPHEGTHQLEEFCRWLGIDHRGEDVPALYQVIPSGRAPEALRECYRLLPASRFRGQTCRSELLSTSHFHIDQHGDLFTGLCAGLAPAAIDDLHPTITEDTHPVFCRLCVDGPFGLMRLARERFGYEERSDGYASKCDLCFDVRRRLHATGGFPELRPGAFYTID
jgi:hypothetical protein